MSFTIRFATPADAATIHEFVVKLATYEREPEAVEVTPEMLAAQLASERPPFECLLAEDGGVAIGCALFFQTYSTWRGRIGLHLEDLFVLPEHRLRGVATALVARVAAMAVARGGGRLEWAVLDWNRPAIEFYRQLGGVPLDTWTTWRLPDAALATLARTAS